MTNSSYGTLLRDRGFQSFLWTQFLGAFNDNVFKMIVSVAAVAYTAGNEKAGSQYLALTGAVFVLPFLLFAGWAGQLADRFSKSKVLIVTKSFEIVTMIFALFALQATNMPMLLGVLFLLAAQANFFSPAKYGILPEILPERDLSRANALLELTTFVAIVIGGGFGTLLFEHWKHEQWKMSAFLISLAVIGSLTSLGIPKVKPSPSTEPFHWNPFAEIVKGLGILRKDRPMALTVAGISFFWFIGGLVQLTLVVFVNHTLHGTESQIGLLVAALAIGIGAGSIAAGKVSGDTIELGVVAPSGVAMGLSACALGAVATETAAFVWLVLTGFFGGLFIVPLNTFLQDEADPAEKGRILATNNFANMVGVILASGVLWLFHDKLHWSGEGIFFAGGVFTIAASFYMLFRHLLRQTVRFFCWTTLQVLFRLTVKGGHHIPVKGGGVVVGNHVSYADAFLIGSATPRFIRWILWKTLYDIKPLTPVFELLRTVPIDLSKPRDAVSTLVFCRNEVEAGELAGIFPEGQITRTGQLLPFKRGYERIAETKGGKQYPIIPAWIDGLWGHPLSMKGGKLCGSWDRWFRPKVTVLVGEPVYGPIPPEALRAKVTELASQAATDRREPQDTIGRRFVTAARKRWGSLGIADSFGKEMTFGKALIGAQLLRRWLDGHAPGQAMVGLLLPNSVGACLANMAVTLSGRTAVNLNFTAGPAAMASAIQQCGIQTVLTSKLFLVKQKIEPMPGAVYIEELLPKFSGFAKAIAFLQARFLPAGMLAKGHTDDVAAIIFSSGSTGEPKGVELTHWNLLSNMEAVAQVYPVGPSDVMLGILPFFHSFGFTYNLWFPLLHQFPVIFHPNPSDAKTIGELSEKYGATFLLSTPTFASTYARKCSKEQFAKIRYVLVGAEKLRPAVAQQFEEKFGIRMHEGYGCTEMAPVVSVNGPDFISDDPDQSNQIGFKAESVGRPLPGVSLRFVDPATMEPVPYGQEGMLLVKGPSRMRGYLGQPERTAKVLVDGYYNTGDMARLDEDGFLHITGRLSRFSKIGGEMVPHLKVEECLQEIMEEAACLVIGIPDSQRGERLIVLHTSKQLTPAQMIDHLNNAGLPALWIPKPNQFFLVDAIPTLGTGKTDLRKSTELAIALTSQVRQPAVAE
ncbi:MAG TPA: acyl-[ACP]--phospholipid O-acyltransferase [Bryobacteraceae bacterium]|nr:acyl-[ACP]--phospholipid O-acyltransferase [Bryobacteraceae bacterium]